MGCQECRSWKCQSLSYAELVEEWGLAIGGDATPGHKKRFTKEAGNRGIPFDNIRLRYKYCSKGILTRFYIGKSDEDTKDVVPMRNCREFNSEDEGSIDIDMPSPLWTACTIESHGPSKHRGIPFTTGLYEKGIYFRVPMCGSVRPMIRNKKLTVTLSFDSNEKYLRWWGKLYPQSFQRLNQ